MRVFRSVVWILALLIGSRASAVTSEDVVISPESKGVFIDKFFQDYKIAANPNPSDSSLDNLFIDDALNGIRTPIWGNINQPAHPSDGVVVGSYYTAHINTILRARERNPNLIIFASKKLNGQNSFPSWVKDSNGVLPEPYAQLLADYIEHMYSEGITIDVLGVDNERSYNEGNITASMHKQIVDELRLLAVERGFQMPLICGHEDFGPRPDWMEDLINGGYGDSLDIYGTHYYPQFRPLSNLKVDLNWAGAREKWHTELHWDKLRYTDEMAGAEEALSTLWDCTDNGMNGLIWWSYSRTGFRGSLMRQFSVPILRAYALEVDDVDGVDISAKGKLQTRAFLRGNQLTVYAINVNSGIDYPDMRFRMDTGAIMGDVSVLQWTSVNQTAGAASTVIPLNRQSFEYSLPDRSISSFTFTYIQPLPYEESFEDGLGIWAQSMEDSYNWTRNSGVTSTANSGPSAASNGTHYLHANRLDAGGSNQTAQMNATLDMADREGVMLSFDYHMYGSDIVSLSVDIFDGTTWTSDVWKRSSEQHTSSAAPWSTALVDLSPFEGKEQVTIRFRAEKESGDASDIAIDDIRVEEDYFTRAYGRWAAKVFSNAQAGTDQSMTGNPDSDRFNNILEWALVTDPMMRDEPAVELSLDSANFVVTYSRRLDSSVSVWASWANTLKPAVWRVHGDGLSETTLRTIGNIETRAASVPLDSDKKFIRIEVEE